MAAPPLRLHSLFVELKVDIDHHVGEVLRGWDLTQDALVDAGPLNLELAAVEREYARLYAGKVVRVVESQLRTVFLGFS